MYSGKASYKKLILSMLGWHCIVHLHQQSSINMG